MIAKRIDMRQASKSRATRLAEYVTSELDKAGRIADVFTVNCLSDDPLIAAKEMEICQARNTRSKDDKTYHLLLSFPDGERPDGDRLREISAAAAKALGLPEHQRIAVVHDDTDNLHMHLIINKIHPQRHTIHTPRHDFKVLGELCANMEKTLALQPTNHEPAKSRAESKAQDMEKHSGIESFLHYAREKASTVLSAAKSWNKVHKALAVVGIAIQARGNGLVLVDKDGGTAIKASSLGREFSKANLEKRLGMFTTIDKEQVETLPGTERRAATYSPKPVTASYDLYQQYLTTKHATAEAKTSELAALWEKQRRLMRDVREAGNIRLPTAIGKIRKRALRHQMRESVKAGVSRIRRNMAKRRAEIKAKYKTRCFIEWLKLEAEQGNVPAIYALRKRGAVAPTLLNITARDLRDVQLIAGKSETALFIAQKLAMAIIMDCNFLTMIPLKKRAAPWRSRKTTHFSITRSSTPPTSCRRGIGNWTPMASRRKGLSRVAATPISLPLYPSRAESGNIQGKRERFFRIPSPRIFRIRRNGMI